MKIITIKLIVFVLIFCSCTAIESSKQTRFALASARGDITLVKQIFESGGVEINSVNGRIGPALVSASYGGHKEVVQFLIANGADINVRDEKGTTPLMNAVIGEKPEIVKLLLEKGANPNLPVINTKSEKNDTTALTFAKIKQNKEIIEALEKAASPDK
jgi:ankyrin repeat protein